MCRLAGYGDTMPVGGCGRLGGSGVLVGWLRVAGCMGNNREQPVGLHLVALFPSTLACITCCWSGGQ